MSPFSDSQLYPQLMVFSVLSKPRPHNGWSSLGTRLRLLLAGLSVFSVAATGSVLLHLNWSEHLASIHTLQNERSRTVAQSIDAFVGSLQRKVIYLGQVQGLVEFDTTTQQQLLDGLTRHSDAYEYIAIADRTGQILSASSPNNVQVGSLVNTPLWTAAYQQQEIYIAPVRIDTRLQKPITVIAVPLYDRANEVAGVLLARLNLSTLNTVVSQTPVGETGYVYIVDERNRIITQTGESVSTLEKLSEEVLTQLGELTTQPETALYSGLTGQSVIGSRHRLENPSWLLVVELPTAEAYAPMRRSLSVIVGVAVGMVIVASSLSWLMARSIVRPLKCLTTAANAIGAGDWQQQVEVRGLNELQSLAVAFNRMIDQMNQLWDKVHNERNFVAAIVEAVGALIIVVDRQGRIVFFNGTSEATLGYRSSEVIGEFFWDLFLMKADRTNAIRKWDSELLEHDQGDAIEYQSQWLTSNGEARLITWSDTVLRNSENEVEYVISTGIDMTAREAAEAARRESEMLLQAFIDNSPEVIYIKDKEGHFLLVNNKFGQVVGLTPQDIIGKYDHDIFPPDIAQEMLKNDRQTMQQSQVVQYEEEVILGEELKTYLSSKFPLRDGRGEVYGICGISTDISDRKQAEQQLQQAKVAAETALTNFQQAQAQLVQSEKMSSLGQLVAGVAHEINNPVSFIFGNINHIENYCDSLLELVAAYQQHYPQTNPKLTDLIEELELDFIQEDLPKVLNSMRFGSERIREIVLSLRNFSRLDEDGEKRVDIHEGIDNTLMILNNRLKAQGNRPEIQVIKNYGDIPLIECFPGQLNQVFINLFVNGIDAIEEKNQDRSPEEINQDPGAFTVTTHCLDQNHIRITLQDTGKGMTSQTQTKLFSPFFTTKPIGKGTGLGLSISYQIITEKHKGQLSCQSVLGEGTTFMIDLPIRLTADAEDG